MAAVVVAAAAGGDVVADARADVRPDARAVVVARVTGARPWRLAPRSPTLSGTIPVRAAQACPPLLAGNAFGLALAPPEPLRIDRGLRSIETSIAVRRARSIDGGAVEIEVDTGLALDEVAGATFVIERCFNRCDRRIAVAPARVAPGAPLIVVLRVAIARRTSITLRGEVATLGLYLADAAPALVPLRSAPDVGRAHAAFFDSAYFAGKRGAPTRKYQRTARREPEPTPRPGPGAFVVHAGGAPPRIVRGACGVAAIELPLEVKTTLSFHGQRVEVDADERALARRARSVEQAFAEALDEPVEVGALRYFTTYVSPHVAGDPHAFFKPATLVAAPRALRLVVDGPEGPGLEALRGVTEPAWFHAMPAVARLLGPVASPSETAPVVRARFTRAEWIAPRVEVVGADQSSTGPSGVTRIVPDASM